MRVTFNMRGMQMKDMLATSLSNYTEAAKKAKKRKVQTLASVCSQIVYKHPLTLVFYGGKLALALRRKEC